MSGGHLYQISDALPAWYRQAVRRWNTGGDFSFLEILKEFDSRNVLDVNHGEAAHRLVNDVIIALSFGDSMDSLKKERKAAKAVNERRKRLLQRVKALVDQVEMEVSEISRTCDKWNLDPDLEGATELSNLAGCGQTFVDALEKVVMSRDLHTVFRRANLTPYLG